MNKIIGNLIPIACYYSKNYSRIIISSLVLTATSMHTKPHLLNARARGLHCVYVALVIHRVTYNGSFLHARNSAILHCCFAALLPNRCYITSIATLVYCYRCCPVGGPHGAPGNRSSSDYLWFWGLRRPMQRSAVSCHGLK